MSNIKNQSVWDALYRGGLQGATAGFEDEAGAGLQALMAKLDGDPYTAAGNVYTQARHENRSANDAARSAHPAAYVGGQVAGGVLSPLNKLAAGAAAPRAMGALGAGHALGNSTATDLPTQALDTAEGGLTAAMVGRLLPRPSTPKPQWHQNTNGFDDTVLSTRLPSIRADVPEFQRVAEEARQAAIRAEVARGPQTIADVERIIAGRGPMATAAPLPTIDAPPVSPFAPLPRPSPLSELDKILRTKI